MEAKIREPPQGLEGALVVDVNQPEEAVLRRRYGVLRDASGDATTALESSRSCKKDEALPRKPTAPVHFSIRSLRILVETPTNHWR